MAVGGVYVEGKQAASPTAREPICLIMDGQSIPPDAERAFGRTLRIALAMRGGVSLAVWIGGAVAELDILRRIRIYRTAEGPPHSYLLHPGPAGPETEALIVRAAVYADLLRQAQYDEVEFDILAGASAGGMNAVMYAVVQRSGTGMDSILKLWEAGGGIAELLRPLGCRPVDSLLQGEDRLRQEIGEVLDRLYTKEPSHQGLKAENITVDLSATVIDSGSSPNPEVEEGRGNFHFEGRKKGDPGTGGPADTIPPVASDGQRCGADGEALRRLAYAARTTSSFPGAFEPAKIYSVPTTTEAGPDGAGGSRQYPDMSFVFDAHRSNSDAAAGQKPFRVIDGGIFDNIPIERALRAARTRSSDHYADRALIYLDPDPSHAEPAGRWDKDLSRLIPTLAAAAKRMRRRESDATEVRSVYEFLDAQLVAKGRQEALAQLLNNPAADLNARRGAYVRYRSTADMEMLSGLLTNPSEWQLTSTLTQRQAFTAVAPDTLQMLPDVIIKAYGQLVPNGPPTSDASGVLRGPQALFDAASCILSWVRYLETLAAIEPDLRSGLLGNREIIRGIRNDAYCELQRAVCLRDPTFLQLLQISDSPDPTILADSVTAAWLGGQVPVSGGAWITLDACVATLQGIAGELNTRLGDGTDARWKLDWAESSWHALTVLPDAVKAADLPPAFCATRIPPAVSSIMYRAITGDEKPAEAAEFTVLQKARRRRGLNAALRRRDLDEQPKSKQNIRAQNIRGLVAPPEDELPAKAKLAGVGLLNFRGFLRKEWRRNDWVWGRMDAAAGMARFLRTLDVTTGDASAGEAEKAKEAEADDVRTLQDAVLKGHGLERGSMSGGAEPLGRLGPVYRVSLLSRGLRVLNRALAGTPRLPRPASETGLFLLQPLLVVVPALADPPRAVLIAALMIGCVWLSAGSLPPAGEPQGVFTADLLFLLFAAAFIVLLGRTWRQARRKWSRIEHIELPAPDVSATMAEERTAIRKALLAAASSLPVLVLLWLAMHRERWGIAIVLLLALAVVERTVAIRAVSVSTAPARGFPGRTLLAVVAVLGVVVLLVAEALPGDQLPGVVIADNTWVRAGAMSAAAFLAGTALTYGWLRFWPCLAVAFLSAVPVFGIGHYAPFTGGNFWLDLLALGAAIELWAAALWWLPVFSSVAFAKTEKLAES